MRPRSKSFALVLIAIFIGLSVFCLMKSEAVSQEKKTPIIVGGIGPITGPNAEWGRKNRLALQMLEDEMKAAGGVKGYPVEIHMYDSAQDAKQVASLVRKLARDENALGIAGPLFSSMCEVAFPLANAEGIVSISQASAKPGLAAANRPWGFRNTIDEETLAKVLVPIYIRMFNVKKMATIYDIEDATSSALGKSIMINLFKANGVPVVNENDHITFRSHDADVSAQVTKIKSLNVDGVIIGADFGPASVVIREMNKQGLFKPVIGGTPLISDTVLTAAGKVPVLASATFYPGGGGKNIQNFMEKFRERAKAAKLDTFDPTMYDVNIYDNAKMILQAAAKTDMGLTPKTIKEDRVKVRDYLTNLKDGEFEGGVSGFRSFNKDGDANKTPYYLMVEGGKWKEAK
jgi:branched-chain amino acid transport system substrate-binding protein